MDDRKLQIIKQLMEELEGEMSYSPKDFDERLGKGEPKVEVVKMEGDMPEMEGQEEMMGKDLDSDMEMGEDPEHAEMVMGPESKLKARLMKMRGAY